MNALVRFLTQWPALAGLVIAAPLDTYAMPMEPPQVREAPQPSRLATPEDLGITSEMLDAMMSHGSAKQPTAVSHLITVSSGDYDPTVLTKYIPGTAFIPLNIGTGVNHSGFGWSGACIRASAALGEGASYGVAPIELPGNALLRDAVVHLYDNTSSGLVAVKLFQTEMLWSLLVLPAGPPTLTVTRENSQLAVGGTDLVDSPGWVAATLDPDPDVVTGSTWPSHKFFSIWVSLDNTGGDNLQFCGAEIHYQVPTSGNNLAFRELTPCRIFDSRPTNGGTGKFSANEVRTINVTGDTIDQGGVGWCWVPEAASAVQVNVVVVDPDGTGSLKLWEPAQINEPQGLLAYQTSPSFWNGSGVVPISTSGEGTTKRMQVKTNSNGAHVYIAVTGYYSGISNMGN